MKNNLLLICLLLFFNTFFGQEQNDSITTSTFTKWRLEGGFGYSHGVGPYKDGYYSTLNNRPFGKLSLNSFRLGASYFFSRNYGIKSDISFDRFKNLDTKSKTFETGFFRVSVQLLVNLTRFYNAKEEPKFNILFHGGVNLGSLKTIKTTENETIGSPDLIGGLVLGVMPTYRISKKSALFFDFSSFHNYRQNHTWDGHVAEENDNLSGKMLNGTIGITYSLGKN
ncbi:MAG: hypothetical protein PSV16_10785 [Flavobacterium sp.]|nr:hypothetical protein [Flavobacterium sp.]